MRPGIVSASCAVLLLAACSPVGEAHLLNGFGGNPAHGAVLIGRTQCGACHEIPGIQEAHGLVGPPLTHFARRTIIAGVLANTPDNLVHWLRDPQSVTPGNAMPATGLDDQQARDVAAYLCTLQ